MSDQDDSGLDRVRAVMSAPIDVEPTEDPADDAGPDAGPEQDMREDAGPDDAIYPDPVDPDEGIDWEAVGEACGFPLNDYGNGRRFQRHFGQDVIWVPRMGFFLWDGIRWAKDADEIGVRGRAHQMGDLVAREARFIRPADAHADRVGQRDHVAERLDELDAAASLTDAEKAASLTDAEKAERTRLRGELKAIDDILGQVKDRVGQRLRHAKQAGNSATIKNMLTEGGVLLARPLDLLDADPLVINTRSHTIRFKVERTGSIRRATFEALDHDRAMLITKVADVVYDANAGMPQFQTFLNRIMPDVETQGFLQRVFGLSLLGVVEQALYFFYGDGANGKSVLVDLIARILGDYSASAKIESLTGSNRRGGGDATPDLVPMIGARMVRASEPEKGTSWQEGLIKELTGGEPMLIRALHSDFVEARVFFKLIVSGNYKPDFRGTDDGIWRRVKLVPFTEQIPEGERRPKQEMDDMLFAEAPGILNWMIEGALNYLEGGLMEPASVRSATQELREESDPYGAFLDDACIVSGEADDRIGSAELVNAFHFWLAMRGEGQFKDRTVANAMKDHARRWRSKKTGQKFHPVKSGGLMAYDGIRFTDFFRKSWADAPKDVRGRPIISAPSASSSMGMDD